MKINSLMCLTFLMIFLNYSFAQGKSKDLSFDKLYIITIKEGFENQSLIIGTNPKLSFDEKKDIYKIEYISLEKKSTFLSFKVFKREGRNVLARIVGDDSPNPLSFKVKDNSILNHSIEFVTEKFIDKSNRLRIIYKLSG